MFLHYIYPVSEGAGELTLNDKEKGIHKLLSNAGYGILPWKRHKVSSSSS